MVEYLDKQTPGPLLDCMVDEIIFGRVSQFYDPAKQAFNRQSGGCPGIPYSTEMSAVLLVEREIARKNHQVKYAHWLSETLVPGYQHSFVIEGLVNPTLNLSWLLITAPPDKRCIAALKTFLEALLGSS
jgi:hypothetical protein